MICIRCPAKISLVKLDQNVKKALVVRLQHFLNEEERQYSRWTLVVRQGLKKTAADHIDRRWRQRIQAFRMVIWILSPYKDRDGDFPGFWTNEKPQP